MRLRTPHPILAGCLVLVGLLAVAGAQSPQPSPAAGTPDAAPQIAPDVAPEVAPIVIAAPNDPAAPPTATAPGVPVVPVVPVVPPVPLLWKVSDADNAVYLLGAFHMLKPDDYPLSPDVDAAFANSQSVLFELPPQEMAAPTLALQMGQAALRIDGTTLDDELPRGTERKLRAWLDANAAGLQQAGITGKQLQGFEPWYVGLVVSLIDMAKQGLDPRLGLDAHFSVAAQQSGKATGGFETGAQQIAFLDGMDAREQLQFLDEALTQSTDGAAEVDKLHAAWRAGDAALLWDGMALDMQRQYPALYQRINVERNRAWLPLIEQRLQQSGTDGTLVVVGALHLLGSDGVVEGLRARGYTVERVCTACAKGTPDVVPAAAGMTPPTIVPLPAAPAG